MPHFKKKRDEQSVCSHQNETKTLNFPVFSQCNKLLIWKLGLYIVKSFLGILKVPSESMYEAVKS